MFDATVVNPVPPLATVTVSDKVDPAAVTVIGADPSKSTPLIALGVASVVASAANVAVPAFPVIVVCTTLVSLSVFNATAEVKSVLGTLPNPMFVLATEVSNKSERLFTSSKTPLTSGPVGPVFPVAPVSPLGPLEVIETELAEGEATETDVELAVKLTEVPLPVEVETIVPPVVVTFTLI